MGFISDAEVRRAVQLLRDDRIAVAASRHHSAIYALTCPAYDTQYVFVDRGEIRLPHADEIPAADITIDGEEWQWQLVLAGLHGGLHRAWRYKLLNFTGDAVRMMFLWKFMWRLSESLVAARGGR